MREWEERTGRAGERKERLFEDTIAKNFSNLMKNFNPKNFTSSSRKNSKRYTPRHRIIKLSKLLIEKEPESKREKHLMYKGSSIRLIFRNKFS